jgi:hypothetical protein
MTLKTRLRRDDGGTAAIELAFGFPALIMLIWLIFQLGLVFRANSGIQHSLGQGARFATLFPTPTNNDIEDKMDEAVYGIGPGEFEIEVDDPDDDPATPTIDESKAGYKDLTVTYTQQTNLLLIPGPTVSLTKNKRVWVAGN